MPEKGELSKPDTSWPLFFVAFSPVFLFVALSLFWPWVLVNKLSPWIYVFSGICGALFGVLIVDYGQQHLHRDITVKQRLSLIAMPAIVFLFFPGYLWQIYAFVGADTEESEQSYLIIGRGSAKGPSSIRVTPLSRQKTNIRVLTTGELERAYFHGLTRDRDCLILQTQLGRSGIERVRTYAFFGKRADMANVRFDCTN